MVSALALLPMRGATANSERAQQVRRLLLRQTRCRPYYRVRGETLEALAVWHAVRGTDPGL